MVASTSTNPRSCIQVNPGDIVISRTSFIIAITACIFATSLSILGLTALLYRECARRRQAQAAKKWGRKSTYNQRISLMRKEVDDSISRQFSGCLYNDVPENPFLQGCEEQPVELGCERKVYEAPATVPVAKVLEREKRKSRVLSLWFDHRHGVWMPKR